MTKSIIPSRNAIETVKTVVIAVLITGVVAFVGGMYFQGHLSAQVQAAVVEATSKK